MLFTMWLYLQLSFKPSLFSTTVFHPDLTGFCCWFPMFDDLVGVLMPHSRCIVHHPHELQSGKSPSLRHFPEARPLLVVISPVPLGLLTNKDGCAHNYMYCLCFCTTLVVLKRLLYHQVWLWFNVDLKCSYTLYYIHF